MPFDAVPSAMGVATLQTLWMTPVESVVDEVSSSTGSSTSVPEPSVRCATTPDRALLESSVSVRPPPLVCAPGLTTVTESVAAIASPGGHARAEATATAEARRRARTAMAGLFDRGMAVLQRRDGETNPPERYRNSSI